MALPPGVRKVTNIKGDRGEKGSKGDTGSLAFATAESVPAEQPAAVQMTGPSSARGAHFQVPRGLPGVNAVPADEAVSVFASAKDTKTRKAIDKIGAPAADDGHAYALLAGVIRNTGDGNGWQLLPESTNHRPINITNVETIDDTTGPYGYIRVHYDVVGGGGMTVLGAAVTDETLARNGFTVGTSVTQTYMDIRISQSLAEVTDYLSWDTASGQFISQDGKFQTAFSSGILTLTHESIDQAAQYNVTLTPRGSGYRYVTSTQSGSFARTSMKVEILDDASGYEDYVYYDGTQWVSQGGVFTGMTFSGGVLTLTHPSIPASAVQRVQVTPRGGWRPFVDTGASPVTQTTVKIAFQDSVGSSQTTPSTSMRAYVRHGGPTGGRVTAGAAGMALSASHGGGQIQWKPSALNTIVFPGSNIWLYAMHGFD